jgi:hypothetical protein
LHRTGGLFFGGGGRRSLICVWGCGVCRLCPYRQPPQSNHTRPPSTPHQQHDT